MWREVKTMFSQNRCLPSLHFLLLYFSFRFITPDDEQWFNTQLVRSVEENVSPDVGSYILPEPYFVDFLREMPEPTGDEPEDTTFEVPKVYELVFSGFFDHSSSQIFLPALESHFGVIITSKIVICCVSCHHTPSEIFISKKFSSRPIGVRYKTSMCAVISIT